MSSLGTVSKEICCAFSFKAPLMQLLAYSPPVHCGSSYLRILSWGIVDPAGIQLGSSCLRILSRGIVDPAACAFSLGVSWIQLLAHSPPGHHGSSWDPAACAFSPGASWIQLGSSCLRILPRGIVDPAGIQLLAHPPPGHRGSSWDPAACTSSPRASWIQLGSSCLMTHRHRVNSKAFRNRGREYTNSKIKEAPGKNTPAAGSRRPGEECACSWIEEAPGERMHQQLNQGGRRKNVPAAGLRRLRGRECTSSEIKEAPGKNAPAAGSRRPSLLGNL